MAIRYFRVVVVVILPLRTQVVTHPGTSGSGWCVLLITLRDLSKQHHVMPSQKKLLSFLISY